MNRVSSSLAATLPYMSVTAWSGVNLSNRALKAMGLKARATPSCQCARIRWVRVRPA